MLATASRSRAIGRADHQVGRAGAQQPRAAHQRDQRGVVAAAVGQAAAGLDRGRERAGGGQAGRGSWAHADDRDSAGLRGRDTCDPVHYGQVSVCRAELLRPGTMFRAAPDLGTRAAMTSDLLINSPWADHAGADAAERAEAERVQHEDERRRAARVIAAAARDTADARDLLAMLGLGARRHPRRAGPAHRRRVVARDRARARRCEHDRSTMAHDSQRQSADEFFATRAATWDERFPDDGPRYERAVAELAPRRGGVAVDVGCGTGRALPFLRAAVGPAGVRRRPRPDPADAGRGRRRGRVDPAGRAAPGRRRPAAAGRCQLRRAVRRRAAASPRATRSRGCASSPGSAGRARGWRCSTRSDGSRWPLVTARRPIPTTCEATLASRRRSRRTAGRPNSSTTATSGISSSPCAH